METLVLEAKKRDSTIKPKLLRSRGQLPAVYYGAGQNSHSLVLDYQTFRKLFAKAGENTIIELSIDGKVAPVLVHDIQYDPVTSVISHVDFLHIDMTKEVTTSVKVVVIGIAPAVKNLGGILDLQKHEIKIRCLPKDLIHSIEVDVSSIADFHTSIHVKDLKIPKTVKVLDNPDDTVITATPPREEEEKPAAAVSAEGAGVAAGATEPGMAAAAAGATAGAPAGKEGKKG